MNHITKYLLAVLLIVLPAAIQAQVKHISGNVFLITKHLKDSGSKDGREPISPAVYIFYNKAEARKQVNLYKEYKKKAGEASTFQIEDANMVKEPDYEGHFEADITDDGAMVVIYGQEVKIVEITSAVDYEIGFTDNSDTSIHLGRVDVIGKQEGVRIQEMMPIDEGPVIHWGLNVYYPAYYTTRHTRLIFQPAVVDINTKDTIQHLEPLIYEGKAYHINQTKRKSFDYNRNDSVKDFLVAEPLPHNKPFSFEWKIAYLKPNIDHSYKWVSDLVLEDYTHLLINDSTHKGMERWRKPWKMIDVSMAKKEMELTREFYEEPHAQTRETARDLQVYFKVGSDELTTDSANQINFDLLVSELKSYGKSLMNFTVQGGTSPEGNVGFNQRLADKRARKALDIIGASIKTAGRQVKPGLLYTWNDVADSLEARGQKTEANELREYAGARKISAINQMIAANPVIGEIMSNQRMMKCTYTILQNKPMDPQTALWTYYNDPDFREGGERTFSNGDYYNLFKQITDSVELRKLTYRAYRQNAARRSQKYSPFAAYVANRMAIYAIDKDSVDINILAPFVDMQHAAYGVDKQLAVSFENNKETYVVNRRAIVANQAIMYFKAKKLGQAQFLANKLPDSDEYKDIKMLTDLETLFFKQNKSEEEQRRAMTALRYAMGRSKLNNAVLNFELANELGHELKDVKPLVDSLDDNVPQKWYMEGVIAAQDPDNEDEYMDLVSKVGPTEALRMTEVPTHLAYFQHCFDINEQYRAFYESDAYINDEVRNQYPYKEEDADKYRNKFNAIMHQGPTGTEDAETVTNDNDESNNNQ